MADADYNAAWSKLNNVPVNTKWDAVGQRKYIDELTAKNPGIYKTPTIGGATMPVTTPPTGLMTQTPASTTTAPKLDTFESIEQNKYGAVAPPASPVVSSAPPAGSTWADRAANHGAASGTSLSEVANSGRNNPVAQTATNFTGKEAYGTGTGPNGTYTFDDQARDRFGAANTNEWTANMANAPPDPGAPSPWVNPMDEINRRLAERGLPPQAPAGTGGTGGAGTGGTGTAPGLMQQTENTVKAVNGKVGYEARQLADPTKWNVDEDQTVAGQVQKLIRGNDEIQQMETTRAKQGMNAGGLMNSSMGLQAVEAARYAAAMPIATADAATYGRAAAYNADTQNQFAGKNVDASNTAYAATAGERAATARDTAATIAQANLTDKQGNISAQAAANLANVNKEAASAQAGVNAATAEKLAQTNTAAAVLKAQNDSDVAAAGAINQQALASLNANIAKANLGQSQSIQTANDLTATIQSIRSRTDINGDVKDDLIQKALNSTNATLELINRATSLTGDLLRFEDTTSTTTPPPGGTTPPGLLKSSSGSWSNGAPLPKGTAGPQGRLADGNGGWT